MRSLLPIFLFLLLYKNVFSQLSFLGNDSTTNLTTKKIKIRRNAFEVGSFINWQEGKQHNPNMTQSFPNTNIPYTFRFLRGGKNLMFGFGYDQYTLDFTVTPQNPQLTNYSSWFAVLSYNTNRNKTVNFSSAIDLGSKHSYKLEDDGHTQYYFLKLHMGAYFRLNNLFSIYSRLAYEFPGWDARRIAFGQGVGLFSINAGIRYCFRKDTLQGVYRPQRKTRISKMFLGAGNEYIIPYKGKSFFPEISGAYDQPINVSHNAVAYLKKGNTFIFGGFAGPSSLSYFIQGSYSNSYFFYDYTGYMEHYFYTEIKRWNLCLQVDKSFALARKINEGKEPLQVFIGGKISFIQNRLSYYHNDYFPGYSRATTNISDKNFCTNLQTPVGIRKYTKNVMFELSFDPAWLVMVKGTNYYHYDKYILGPTGYVANTTTSQEYFDVFSPLSFYYGKIAWKIAYVF